MPQIPPTPPPAPTAPFSDYIMSIYLDKSVLTAKYIPMLVVMNVFWWATTLMFIYRRNEPGIKVRGLCLSLVSCACTYTINFITMQYVAMDIVPIDCNALIWGANILIPVLLTSVIGRVGRLIVLYQVSLAQSRRMLTGRERIWVWLRNHSFTSDKRLGILALALTPVLILICGIQHHFVASFPLDNFGLCYSSPNTWWKYWPVIVSIVLFCVAAPAAIFGIYRSRDVWGMTAELVLSELVIVPSFITFLALYFNTAYSTDIAAFVHFPIYVCIWIPALGLQIFGILYPVLQSYGLTWTRMSNKAAALLTRKTQAEPLRFTKLSFTRQLLSREGFASLQSFAVKEFTVENMIFLDRYMSLQQDLIKAGMWAEYKAATAVEQNVPLAARTADRSSGEMAAAAAAPAATKLQAITRALPSLNMSSGLMRTLKGGKEAGVLSAVDTASAAATVSASGENLSPAKEHGPGGERRLMVEHLVSLISEQKSGQPVSQIVTTADGQAATAVPPALMQRYADLYRAFVAVNSDYELNIMQTIRKPLDALFAKEGGAVHVACFDLVAAEVVKMVYLNTFQNYVKMESARAGGLSTHKTGGSRTRDTGTGGGAGGKTQDGGAEMHVSTVALGASVQSLHVGGSAGAPAGAAPSSPSRTVEMSAIGMDLDKINF